MLAELAAAVRERRVSATELVRMSLERIDELDLSLNSVVARRDAEALSEAARITERIAAGDDAGPLGGLPLLVKDNVDVAGLRTTNGSLTLSERPPAERDALLVRRLREAGAIVVGKTNVPEYCAQGYTANRLFGATRNPWAPQWSPGGSSGGSGAALAAGLAAIATASDGGGSARIPASFCGLAGLKPTNGIVARSPTPEWIDFSTKGPVATSIADLRLLLSVIAGPADGDPSALPVWVPAPGNSEPPRRLFATPRLWPYGPLPSTLDELFASALRSLEQDVGFEIEPLDPSSIFRSGPIDEDWYVTIAAEQAHAIGAAAVEEHAERWTPEFLASLRDGLSIPIERYLDARRRRFDYCRELDELLGVDGVLVCPTMCSEGWSAEGVVPGAEEPGTVSEAYNCQQTNVTGHPSLSVPAGRSPNGVPFGLQFIGPRFRDALVLEMGARWEQANAWRRSAPGYAPFEP